MEIKEIVAGYFEKLTLGRISELYSTEDNRVFVKYDYALQHCLNASLGPNNIHRWYYQLGVREFVDNDVVRNRILRSDRLWFTNNTDEKHVPDTDICINTLEILIEADLKEFVGSKFTITEVLSYIRLLLKYD